MKRAFSVWIACVSLACYSMVTKATVPIPGARTVLSPPGVTLQAVEVGVLAGIIRRALRPATTLTTSFPKRSSRR